MPERDEVWWGPAPHKETSAYRPWLLLSTDEHPFAAEECIGVAMTTQSHTEAIRVPDDAWTSGGSSKQAYVSPWYVATMKHAAFDRRQGSLHEPLIERVASALHSYTPESPTR
ncbi:type II toxin-antitoxin system PemK/MazF family toxin [Halobacteria archaeon HArc-gm2]|nr:type II toxin-antitoxin system PemK/MazF family toxin [Halobacteria archaeon HArc-gm2]